MKTVWDTFYYYKLYHNHPNQSNHFDKPCRKQVLTASIVHVDTFIFFSYCEVTLSPKMKIVSSWISLKKNILSIKSESRVAFYMHMKLINEASEGRDMFLILLRDFILK